MAFIYDLTDTWNAGGTTFNGIKMNVTDTASAAASRLVSLQVGGVERFSVDKAGIGTFASVVRAAAGSTGAPAFSFGSDTNTGMWSPSADAIAFSTAGGERVRVTNAGDVGIGTTSPGAYRLNIRSDQFTSVLVESTQTGSYLQLKSSLGTAFISTPSADAFAIHTGASAIERMRITSAGNVGIGTSSPTFRLQVETDTNDNAGAFVRNSNTGAAASGAVIATSGVGGVSLRAHSAAHSVWPNASLIQSDSGFTGGLNILQAGANPITFWTNGSQRMRITSAGDVGIGTSAPSSKLHINETGVTGGRYGLRLTQSNLTAAAVDFVLDTSAIKVDLSSTNAAYPLSFSVGGTERMRVSNTGVGIGTSAPAFRLESAAAASGTIATLLRVTNSAPASVSAGQGSQIGFANDSGWGSNLAGAIRSTVTNPNNGASDMSFHGWNGSTLTERMRITSAGNVGIGTAAPNAAARLDVTSTTSGFLPPRMTTTQRDAIGSPPNGLMLYNTTTDKLQVRAGGAWVDLH
jgi:hypothetical protein